MITYPVCCEQLGKRFGSRWAVQNLDLNLVAGEVFGFLGPNGAGKSTTIRLLMGMLRPTSGAAWLGGHPVADVAQAHRYVGFVPADVVLWPQLTGRETLDLMAHIGPGRDAAYEAELIERFELDPNRRTRTYSTGNRQKVALVAAFSTRAPVLIMDEPTSGLDPLMERVFRACLTEAKGRGQTIFLSSHQLGEVEAVCDRVGILRAGRLVKVAGLAELRQLRRLEVAVGFAGRAPDPTVANTWLGVAGAYLVAEDRLALQLTGSLGPALKHLAEANPVSLSVREPTLEEIFLEYYGDQP